MNDKMRYAAERCIEVMCKDEPYRLHPLGERKALPTIEPPALTSAYENWLREASMDLYVVGDTTFEEIEELVQRHFNLERTVSSDYKAQTAVRGEGEANTVIERLNIGQGKLNMGLRTSITYADDQYAAALMYNGILGGYPHSKLFVNVREKKAWPIMLLPDMTGTKALRPFNRGLKFPIMRKQ